MNKTNEHARYSKYHGDQFINEYRIGVAVMQRLSIIIALFAINGAFAANPFSIALSLPVFCMCFYGLWKIKSPYVQPADVFWFTIYVFFCLSPLQRMELDGTIGGGITRIAYSPEEYITATGMVVSFLFPFLFVRLESSADTDAPVRTFSPSLLMFINLASFGAFVMAQGGLGGVLSARLSQDRPDAFIGSMAFLAFQLITATILVSQARRDRSNVHLLIYTTIALALVVVSRNPFNASRFSLLAAWIPIFLALIGGRLKASYFYIASLFGMMVAFPVLSLTTRIGVDALEEVSRLEFSENFLRIPFVDIYDTSVHTVNFMGRIDWMLGQKLLAIVLFFVPRALWPEKPIVGGLDVGYELYYAGMAGTPNLSFFVASDLYMDFGMLGCIVGGIVLAAILARAVKSSPGTFNGVNVFNFVIIASMPILLRGPVGAILPLFTMQVFAILILRWLSIPEGTKGMAEVPRIHPHSKLRMVGPTQ